MITSVILSTIFFAIVLLPTAYAKENDKQYDTIGDYQLEIIDAAQLPAGVVPIEFNSREEALIYLNEQHNEVVEINMASAIAMVNAQQKYTKGIVPDLQYTLATTYYNGSGYKDFNWCAGTHYVRVTAFYTYYYVGSYKRYKSCNSVISNNNGYTLDSKWIQNYYTASIIDSGRCLAVNVYGTMKHYLLISGLIEVSSDDMHYYAEF